MTVHSDPTGRVLMAAAAGVTPTTAELDALGLTSDLRRKVAEACEDAVARRKQGEHGDARGTARGFYDLHRDELGAAAEANRPVNPHDGLTDPAELAAIIKRRGL